MIGYLAGVVQGDGLRLLLLLLLSALVTFGCLSIVLCSFLCEEAICVLSFSFKELCSHLSFAFAISMKSGLLTNESLSDLMA